MNIPSTSVILLKMTPVNITVISVKKNEIPNNGSTTVQSAAFLLIVTVFLGKIQMSSNTYNGHQLGGATQDSYSFHSSTLDLLDANDLASHAAILEIPGNFFLRSDGANSVSLEDALGIAQHHDAITGNAKQHTTNDHSKHMAFGASEAEAVVNAVLSCFTNKKSRDQYGSMNLLWSEFKIRVLVVYKVIYNVVVTMSVTGQELDPSTRTWIQEESVVSHTELDWREGSEQYKFIENCLASVDRQRQSWLIFLAHRVLGYYSVDFYVEEGSFEEPMGREDLEKLWQKNKVDIALYGHVHNYERSCPVYKNIYNSQEKHNYIGPLKGTIHVIVGGGGASLDEFAPINTT
uniref:Calcineurin-like phosphoesterase domain-containing protein n=1 Tax=Quercus lobata TaxID=97700 RepID=A0A7N2LC63_QUELO